MNYDRSIPWGHEPISGIQGYDIGVALAYGHTATYLTATTYIVWLLWYVFGSDNFRKFSGKYGTFIFILIPLITFPFVEILVRFNIIPRFLWY